MHPADNLIKQNDRPVLIVVSAVVALSLDLVGNKTQNNNTHDEIK